MPNYSVSFVTILKGQPFSVLGPISNLYTETPVIRESFMGFLLADGVNSWSASLQLHKKGGETFYNDYSIETPNSFQGIVTATDNGQGMWAVLLSDFCRDEYSDEDSIVCFVQM